MMDVSEQKMLINSIVESVANLATAAREAGEHRTANLLVHMALLLAETKADQSPDIRDVASDVAPIGRMLV